MIDGEIKRAFDYLMDSACATCKYIPKSEECKKVKGSCGNYNALAAIAKAVSERDGYKEKAEILEKDLDTLMASENFFNHLENVDTELYWRKYKSEWPKKNGEKVFIVSKNGTIGDGIYCDKTVTRYIKTMICDEDDIEAWMPMPKYKTGE